jgi:hypothetical protein
MENTQSAIKEWRPLLELCVVLVTVLGSTVPLYIHMDNRAHEQVTAIHQTLEGIRQDMRDFHGRLCAIEERNKGK